MASYQDLESRMGVLERKVDFLMSLGTVTKRTPSQVHPAGFTEEQLTLTDFYREITNAGELENLVNGV